MFNVPSIRIGKLFGIPVEVNLTWFLVFALIAGALSFSYFPEQFPARPAVYGPLLARVIDVLSGLATALLFFVSIVLHETSHSLVARAGGVRISKITLFIFGGVAQMDEEPRGPQGELLMAVAGPATSVLLGVVFGTTWVLLEGLGVSDVWWAPLQYLSVINVAVAVFNLLPGFPLDGGRILRAVLWRVTGDVLKATRWASRAGEALGFGFMALAILGLIRGSFDFVWLGLIGWFLTGLAEQAYRQQVVKSRLSDLSVSEIMSPAPVVAPADIDLETMVERYFLGDRHSKYPVTSDNAVLGLVDMGAVKAVPRRDWPHTTVADVAARDIESLRVSPDAEVDEVLSRLSQGSVGALLVMTDGRLEGIVTRSDVVRAVRASEMRG